MWGLCSYPHQELWHNQHGPGSPVPLPQFPQKSCPRTSFPPKQRLCPSIPSKLRPPCPPRAPLAAGSRAAPEPDLAPQARREGSRLTHLPCSTGPYPGLLSAAPRGSCPHPDKSWLPNVGLGCPAAPQPHCRGSEHPVGHTQGVSATPPSCLTRKVLQPGETGSSHHKESLLKPNPSLSGAWGALRAPHPPLDSSGMLLGTRRAARACAPLLPHRNSPWADQGESETGKRIKK